MINSNMIIPQFRDELNDNFDLTKLPLIRGTWYHVDPKAGSDNSDGSSFENALASLNAAYDLCTSGAGDGIIVYSGGTTAAHTTSYLGASIDWTKHAITVIGVAAPTGIFSRARIANVQHTTGSITTISFTADHTISDSAGGFLTAGFEAGQKIYVDATSNTNDGVFTISTVTATTITTTAGSTHVSTESAATAGATTIKSYCVDLIALSGNNNSFYNLNFYNGGALSYELSCITITGARNYFGKCLC